MLSHATILNFQTLSTGMIKVWSLIKKKKKKACLFLLLTNLKNISTNAEKEECSNKL